MATKSSLRKLIAKTLNSMEPAEIQRQSREVFERLINHDEFKRAKMISLYLSTNLEVSTIEILKHALEAGGKRCFIPHIVESASSNKQLTETRTRMVMVELKSMRQYDELPTNRFGIKEMSSLFGKHNEQFKIANPETDVLDLVIVPGVAFSLDGRRLGHGKGYYDEFLSDWQRHSPNSSRFYTIGLALREQLVDDPLAIDGEDFKLDEILVAK